MKLRMVTVNIYRQQMKLRQVIADFYRHQNKLWQVIVNFYRHPVKLRQVIVNICRHPMKLGKVIVNFYRPWPKFGLAPAGGTGRAASGFAGAAGTGNMAGQSPREQFRRLTLRSATAGSQREPGHPPTGLGRSVDLSPRHCRRLNRRLAEVSTNRFLPKKNFDFPVDRSRNGFMLDAESSYATSTKNSYA